MSVKKIIVHDEYEYDDQLGITHDYAIIQLTEKITFSSVANAACLPSFSDITTTDGKMLTISGWGLIEKYSDYEYIETTVLQTATIEGKIIIINNQE